MSPAEVWRTWETRLEREGLGVVEGGSIAVRGGRDTHRPVTAETIEEGRTAVSAWTEWAKAQLPRPMTTRERKIWTMYADGIPVRQIAERQRVDIRWVYRLIDAVSDRCPPAPCPNPWQDGSRIPDHETVIRRLLRASSREVVTRVATLALNAAPRDKLAALFEGDETLMRLVPREGEVMASQAVGAKSAMVRYSEIKISGIKAMDIPDRVTGTGRVLNKRMGHKSVLDVEGRPHAGGIDVAFPVKHEDGRDGTVIRTIAWSCIEVADRIVEE